MSLEGEVALITGSSRGVGLAIARLLHAEGCEVLINYIHEKEETFQVLRELRAMAVPGDVTNATRVKQIFQEAEDRYGPVTIVVNNALTDFKFNGDARQKIDEIQWSDFDKHIRVAVQGALNTTQAAISGFKKKGYGRIINIGSNLVQNPVVPYHDYTTSKGALLAFTRTLAAELGPLNVTCNMVAGGLLRVTDASSSTPKEVFDQIAAITPLRRVATPEELAGAVLFFAGPHSKCVTGQQVIVDGGLCMS